ncbi:MAG: hypothetical protein ACJAZS_000156 [Alteromonas naphthalenivorans]|jgi:hypothetical protein
MNKLKIKNYNNLYSVCLGMLLLIFVFEYRVFYLLRDHNHLLRTIPVQNFDTLEYRYPYETPQELQEFSEKSPVKIMQKIMNFVDKKNNTQWKSEHVKDFYTNAKLGGGLTCNGMSELFLHALRLQGYKARKLFVVKNIGDPYATHTLVEVFQDGKWVIYDPTFNVSFERDGHLLGATDIAKSLLDGSFKDIRSVFYGEVAYKARLETYPIYWLAHFNNVLMFQYGNDFSSHSICKIIQLPLRYWQGPVLYYFSPNGVPNNYLEIINWLYFVFTCIGPVLFLILILICFILNKFKKRKNDDS